MTNFIYTIISALILLGWFCIDYRTGLSYYYEALNANVDLRLHNTRKKAFDKYYICFAGLLCIINIVLLNFFKNSIYKDFYLAPAVMATLLLGVGFTALFTDPPTHTVNRHSLRYVYLVNIILSAIYSFIVPNGLILYLLPIVAIELVIIGFLFFTSVLGPSDLRAMLAFMPFYFIVFKNATLYVIIVHFLGIALGHSIQKRQTHKAVPIAHWLILPAPILGVIFTFVTQVFPSLAELLSVQVLH